MVKEKMNALAENPKAPSVESSKALYTAKVYAETLRWIKREQHRRWEETGTEPTVAEVIAAAIEESKRVRLEIPPKVPKHREGKITVPERFVSAVESFLSWLETPPDTIDREEMRAFILKRMKVEDPLLKEEPVKRKNAG